MTSHFIRCWPLVFAAPALAQAQGATVVLDRFGQHVDGNSFLRRDGVYLSGGPREACAAPGLQDGVWCFQITDPQGTTLLSPDPLTERCVLVVGGVFAQYLGTTRVAETNAPCGALNVRLAPFAPTPYPSREYKVWLTRLEDYDPLGVRIFGFDPARSKSDNFRVAVAGPQSILRGRAFFDEDTNGAWNHATSALEVPLGGWRVEVRRDGSLDGVTYTDQDGWYTFVRDRDGASYSIRQLSPNGFVNEGTPGATWLATTPLLGTTVATGERVAGPDFGSVSYQLTPFVGRTVGDWADGYDQGGSSSAAILLACDPLWRTALTTRNGAPVNLRRAVSNDNPNASIFTLRPPPQAFNGAFANWRAYANSNPRDHAGFLLSREVAATILNNTCGAMPGDVLIDRFQDGVLVPLSVMLDGAIGLLSQVGAGLTGPNDPYQDLRHMMIMCTNEFGSINNTGDPSSPQVVYSRTQSPAFFESPY
ncbi:MAG: hypothetical protein JNK02_00220 [Planctomycetes bacterium]|nr:hypothetical protein [Planctomycetota bacterium]